MLIQEDISMTFKMTSKMVCISIHTDYKERRNDKYNLTFLYA